MGAGQQVQKVRNCICGPHVTLKHFKYRVLILIRRDGNCSTRTSTTRSTPSTLPGYPVGLLECEPSETVEVLGGPLPISGTTD
eukprot:792150-Rhodomonas_salina.3